MTHRFILGLLTLCPSLALADVQEIALTRIDTSFVSATMKTYSLDGQVHSVLIEAKTDYGDDLPYVFIACEFPKEDCVSHLVGDTYRYLLQADETQIRLITQSTEDDFETIDVFGR